MKLYVKQIRPIVSEPIPFANDFVSYPLEDDENEIWYDDDRKDEFMSEWIRLFNLKRKKNPWLVLEFEERYMEYDV